METLRLLAILDLFPDKVSKYNVLLSVIIYT